MIYQKGNSWKVKGYNQRFGSLQAAEEFEASLVCEDCGCDPCECDKREPVRNIPKEEDKELSPVELLRKGLWNSVEETLSTTESSTEEPS